MKNKIFLILIIIFGVGSIVYNVFFKFTLAKFEKNIKEYKKIHKTDMAKEFFKLDDYKITFSHLDNKYSTQCFVDKDNKSHCVIHRIQLEHAPWYKIKTSLFLLNFKRYLLDDKLEMGFELNSLSFFPLKKLKKISNLEAIFINSLTFHKTKNKIKPNSTFYNIDIPQFQIKNINETSLSFHINIKAIKYKDILLYNISTFDNNLELEGIIKNVGDINFQNIENLITNFLKKSDRINIKIKRKLPFYLKTYFDIQFVKNISLQNQKIVEIIEKYTGYNKILNNLFKKFKKESPDIFVNYFIKNTIPYLAIDYKVKDKIVTSFTNENNFDIIDRTFYQDLIKDDIIKNK